MREQSTPSVYVYPRVKLTRYLLNDANITERLFLINKKIIANTFLCVSMKSQITAFTSLLVVINSVVP